MLDFLFKKKTNSKRVEAVNTMYKALKSLYNTENISNERKEYLSDLMNRYGYIPYSYHRANNELTNEEVLFVLEQKWSNNDVFSNGTFEFRALWIRLKIQNLNF